MGTGAASVAVAAGAAVAVYGRAAVAVAVVLVGLPVVLKTNEWDTRNHDTPRGNLGVVMSLLRQKGVA